MRWWIAKSKGFLRRGSCEEIKACKETKDCGEVKNWFLRRVIATRLRVAMRSWITKRSRILAKRFLQRDQDLQRHYVVRKERGSRLAKVMKNSSEEILAKRSFRLVHNHTLWPFRLGVSSCRHLGWLRYHLDWYIIIHCNHLGWSYWETAIQLGWENIHRDHLGVWGYPESRKDEGFWRRGSSEEITEREEIKAGKSNEEFLRGGSCKETKDCEVVRNFYSCEEIKDCKRDQGVRRGRELPRVFAKRSGTVKTMKNSCEEVLAKRSRIAKTSRLVKASKIAKH